MNKQIKELAEQAGLEQERWSTTSQFEFFLEKFAELIVAKVLDEVAERAYYSGDSAWRDELDRPWVELEFGFGELAELKNEQRRSIETGVGGVGKNP